VTSTLHGRKHWLIKEISIRASQFAVRKTQEERLRPERAGVGTREQREMQTRRSDLMNE